MAIKSGIPAEITWSLKSLTVLLADEKTVRQFNLGQLAILFKDLVALFKSTLVDFGVLLKQYKYLERVENSESELTGEKLTGEEIQAYTEIEKMMLEYRSESQVEKVNLKKFGPDTGTEHTFELKLESDLHVINRTEIWDRLDKNTEISEKLGSLENDNLPLEMVGRRTFTKFNANMINRNKRKKQYFSHIIVDPFKVERSGKEILETEMVKVKFEGGSAIENGDDVGYDSEDEINSEMEFSDDFIDSKKRRFSEISVFKEITDICSSENSDSSKTAGNNQKRVTSSTSKLEKHSKTVTTWDFDRSGLETIIKQSEICIVERALTLSNIFRSLSCIPDNRFHFATQMSLMFIYSKLLSKFNYEKRVCIDRPAKILRDNDLLDLDRLLESDKNKTVETTNLTEKTTSEKVKIETESDEKKPETDNIENLDKKTVETPEIASETTSDNKIDNTQQTSPKSTKSNTSSITSEPNSIDSAIDDFTDRLERSFESLNLKTDLQNSRSETIIETEKQLQFDTMVVLCNIGLNVEIIEWPEEIVNGVAGFVIDAIVKVGKRETDVVRKYKEKLDKGTPSMHRLAIDFMTKMACKISNLDMIWASAGIDVMKELITVLVRGISHRGDSSYRESCLSLLSNICPAHNTIAIDTDGDAEDDDIGLNILLNVFSDVSIRPMGTLLMFIEDGLPQTNDGREVAVRGKETTSKTSEHMMLQAARLIVLGIKRKPSLASQSAAKMRIVQLCMYPRMPRSVVQCLSTIK